MPTPPPPPPPMAPPAPKGPVVVMKPAPSQGDPEAGRNALLDDIRKGPRLRAVPKPKEKNIFVSLQIFYYSSLFLFEHQRYRATYLHKNVRKDLRALAKKTLNVCVFENFFVSARCFFFLRVNYRDFCPARDDCSVIDE